MTQTFHARYRRELDACLRTLGQDIPLAVVLPDEVILTWRGERRTGCIRPASFHELKTASHGALAVLWGEPGGGPSAPLREQLRQAAAIELESLHGHVAPWWEALGDEGRRLSAIAIVSPHQSRRRRLSVQYFERLTGRSAAREDRFVVIEGPAEEELCREALARHLVDQELAQLALGDRFALQEDLLADSAREILEEMFPDPCTD